MRRGEKQCILMIEQALVSLCPLVWDMSQMAAQDHRHRITWASGLSKGALPQGLVGRGPAKVPQRRVLQPLEERVGSRLRALACDINRKQWPPSPLLLLPAPSSWGPQGSHKVFLGPIGQMPWAPVGGGVWGLVRVPPLSISPSPLCAVRVKLGLK